MAVEIWQHPRIDWFPVMLLFPCFSVCQPLSFHVKTEVEFWHKGSASAIVQNRRRYCLTRSLSPGICRTTGITVGNLHCNKKKKNPANGGGKEGEDGVWRKPWRDGHSLHGEHAGFSVGSTVIRVRNYHWDSRQFKNGFLSLRSVSNETCLLIAANALFVTTAPTVRPQEKVRRGESCLWSEVLAACRDFQKQNSDKMIFVKAVLA